MGSQLARILLDALWWLGYAAGYAADVPTFLKWLLTATLAVVAAALNEPIGSAALICVIGVCLAWWVDRRGPPIL
jgi:hypothetical protein